MRGPSTMHFDDRFLRLALSSARALRSTGLGIEMTRRDNSNQACLQSPGPDDIIESILTECKDRSRFLEVYYLSREPDLLHIMRAIAAMPEDARASLEAFLVMSNSPATVIANLDSSGSLTLSSPEVRETVAMIRFCTETEDLEKPSLPN